MTDFDWIRRRQFAAIATAKFEGDPSYQDLPEVTAEVELLSNWLTDEKLGARRFLRVYPELADDPSLQQIEARFRDPARWNRADAAVVYITGHGDIDEARGPAKHFIVLRHTDRTMLGSTALLTGQLMNWLGDMQIEHLLVIVDVCFAGQVTEEIASWAKEHWLVLASAMKDQQAEQGALAKAISSYLKTAEEYNTSAPYLTVGLFVGALNELLPSDQQVGVVYKAAKAKGAAERDRSWERHICLPNPSYQPRDELIRTDPAVQALALPRDILRLHNRVNGQMPSADSPGWLFTSRKRLMRDLIRATGQPGVTIVTGSAGCGKSAALARLVTLADTGFRRRYARELLGVPADLLPSPGAVDVALSAQRRSTRQVVTQICYDLGIVTRVGSWEDPVRANLEALSEYLASRQEPLTIVLDALDEAGDPTELVRSVLGPLGHRHPRKLCLLIGVRSVGGGRASLDEQDELREPIAELVAATPKVRWIQADDDFRWSRPDIETYVRNVLLNTRKSPYWNADPGVVRRSAEVIGRLAGRSYLMARMAAGSAAGRPAMRAPDDPEWLDELKGGLVSVFRGDLQASLRSPGKLRRGVALLRALAFARGRGLPRHRIWPKLATAVDAVDDAGGEYGDGDVRDLLGSRLNAYLVADEEDGLTVYRPIHDEIREILRYRWRELLAVPPPTGSAPEGGRAVPPRAAEGELRAVEARIARALRDLADVEPGVVVNQVIPAYVRRHLAEHAVAGNVLDRYVPTAFLPYLDLARLRAAVGASGGRQHLEQTVPWLPVVRRVTHLWDWEQPERNAAAIEMWAALGESRLPAPVGGPWQVRWAVQPPDMGNVLGYHKQIPRAAATAEFSGVPIAVTAGEGGLLHIWDLRTGARFRSREPISVASSGDNRGGSAAILSVATARLPNGRPVAITGGSDGTVRAWDLESGQALGDVIDRRDQQIEAVMITPLPDRRIIVTVADVSGVVRSWDLMSRAPVGQRVSCGPRLALGLAAARVGEQVLGLATGQDSGLQAWTLATGIPVGDRRTGHPLTEQAATGTLPGGRVIAAMTVAGRQVAVTGNGDGLLFWDLAEYAPIARRLRGGDGTIRSLAIAQADTRVIAVTGGDRMVQAWDLAADEPAGDLLTGHDGSVEAVAIAAPAAESPDAVLAVSASRDKSIRSWEITQDALLAAGPARVAGIVQAVAAVRSPQGRALAISGSHSDVHVWDLERGGDPALLTGHDSPVVGVAAVQVPNGVLVAASHWDGWISAWRGNGGLVSRAQAAAPSGVTALAMAALADGRPVLAVGGRDGDVWLWDPVVGEPVGEPVRGHAGTVAALVTASAADGRSLIISAGTDGHVLVRDIGAHLDPGHTDPSHPLIGADTGMEIASLAVAASPDGQPLVFIGGERGTVRQLDLVAGLGQSWPVYDTDQAVAALAAGRLPDGTLTLFTGGAESLVQAWDAATGTPVGAPLPVPGPVTAMAFQPAPASLVVGGTGLAVIRPLHGS